MPAPRRLGRIIIGGEDSNDIIDPDARDALITEKSAILTKRLAALWPRAKPDIAFQWAGTFDTTADGLPLIGPVPGYKSTYAAYGYGGNGITFSFPRGRVDRRASRRADVALAARLRHRPRRSADAVSLIHRADFWAAIAAQSAMRRD